MTRLLVIPGAGAGTRLGAEQPKPLVPVAGRPMIDWLLDLYRTLARRVILVVAPSAESSIRRHLDPHGDRVKIAIQPSPRGIVDALLAAAPLVEADEAERVWVTWADQIGVRPSTVARLAAVEEEERDADLVLPTIEVEAPYTCLERGADGRITGVRSRREGDVLPERCETEIGVFSLSRRAYLDDLRLFAAEASPGPRTGELNFLPFIAWLAARRRVVSFPCSEPIEAMGVNTPEELEAMAAVLRARLSSGC
ncbi:MAG TPA: NTP transferase domain-containing protein [Vicinamibacterales bacterium]|nr:NTP transferase domain-containing protein [Vicinamibacterales bacterium]